LKHDEIESSDTCEAFEVIASIAVIEVIIWLRHCATNRKVTGSIPGGVIGIFHWHSLSGLYGLEVDSASNRNEFQEICWGKGGRFVGLTTLSFSCRLSRNMGASAS
jgi:hypothetical protein